MQLGAYLDRIGFVGDVRPDVSTLRSLLQAHVQRVPFENFDVQFGTPLTTDVSAAYDKIVNRSRGGWCYEQNGLFGWALEQAGFDVTRVAAAVMLHVRGESSIANHLSLLVNAPANDITYLADVGFGGSMFEPLALSESVHSQAPFRLSLRQLDDGNWRFGEQAHDEPFEYDFEAAAGDEAAMAAKCVDLQTNPESSFVLNAVVQRRAPDCHYAMRGRVLATTTPDGKQQHIVQSAREYTSLLSSQFGLELPEAESLWPSIVERHDELGLPVE